MSTEVVNLKHIQLASLKIIYYVVLFTFTFTVSAFFIPEKYVEALLINLLIGFIFCCLFTVVIYFIEKKLGLMGKKIFIDEKIINDYQKKTNISALLLTLIFIGIALFIPLDYWSFIEFKFLTLSGCCQISAVHYIF